MKTAKIITTVRVEEMDAVRPHPENPNVGDVDAVRESIRENRFFGTVTAQISTGFILVGNHRWEGARLEGLKRVPVAWADVDDETATRILLGDNRTAEVAGFDLEMLHEILTDRKARMGGLTGTGYADRNLDEIQQLIDEAGRVVPEVEREGDGNGKGVFRMRAPQDLVSLFWALMAMVEGDEDPDRLHALLAAMDEPDG